MLCDIVAVEVPEPFVLALTFEDGTTVRVDIRDEVPFTGIFAPLADDAYFREVRVSADLGTITWPNGADLAPEVLYARAKGGGRSVA
jgi:hypothetical protein